MNWRNIIGTVLIVVAVIYAIEYGLSLVTGDSFQRPTTGAIVAAIVAATLARRRTTNKES